MTEPLIWKLRRIAAGLRQRDIAARVGVSTTRYSAIERGEQQPTDLDRKLIERFLPPLPLVDSHTANKSVELNQELSVNA